MISEKEKKQYYKALLAKDATYDGIFFVGIKSTGIFCHATCPARKPKYENCTFYETAEEALLSGYRPCKRCKPLSFPREIPPLVQQMVELVEANPEKRWKDQDFAELGIHSMTARRQFKKVYGMTFVQYARSRRMGMALKSIKNGEKRIDTQLDAGYDSSSGFYDAFSKIMGRNPKQSQEIKILSADWIDTTLGPMMSIADDEYLYLLEFVDRRGLEREIERLRNRLNASIVPGKTKISEQIKAELGLYFEKKLDEFQTPYMCIGSEFQKSVWQALTEIERGQTSSYKELATTIGNPNGMRAVGNANGANQLAIIIPCHRVIQTDGSLGGYGGGVERKKWLLKHEREYQM
ncbi:bifunctional transcriptional activator/DNA repair enzyme AdaA [Enterococcus quebecensis]|uniref:Cysteine methyltransferase n=1 Tax=Enterococcus quebecensis TaxID=903983 RepID=A0A1E5GTQ9_9ENTE|nr:trifunctional transcriptional activator/DNA repair protein Ada/methylated-DNA--[protein]-cysteine S-methyltransferase [Enterococcus quebecensis]OEG16058.1 cysteine methyltransferase [Enterococcus quebecensis]OJG75039.1 methylated-DNA-[protein]-cysteine S-methyltransferase [Enterococcus quebecensis]